jgi:hypothetical protein
MALSRKLTTTVVLLLQDVRGRYDGSEGEFRHMTPHIDEKSGEDDVDESSDTYDTIEWLINNVPNNNGNVGITGNSYGGFYSVAGMISNHPALKCAAPTAPINDMFVGDDFHHNGAFVRSSACAILLGALFSLLLQTLIVIVTLVRPGTCSFVVYYVVLRSTCRTPSTSSVALALARRTPTQPVRTSRSLTGSSTTKRPTATNSTSTQVRNACSVF